MKPEYNYLFVVCGWVLLWTLAPLIAFFAFLFMVLRHFLNIRRQRRLRARARVVHQHDSRWSQLEGFGQEQESTDQEDWWKS